MKNTQLSFGGIEVKEICIQETTVKEAKKEFKAVSLFSLRMVREKELGYGIDTKIIGPETLVEVCKEHLRMHEEPDEKFYIFTLDTKNVITGISLVSSGTLNASIVHPRDVYKRAILNNANSIILAHNHPSGNPVPSDEDINITNRLIECGKLLGIKVLDHLIIGGGSERYLSFKEKKLI